MDPPLLQPRSLQRLHRHRQQPQQSMTEAGCERYMENTASPKSSEFFLLNPSSAKFHRTPPPTCHRRSLFKSPTKTHGTKLRNDTAQTKREAKIGIKALSCVFVPLSTVTPTGIPALAAPRPPVFPRLNDTGHQYKLKPRRSSRKCHDWTNANTEYRFHDQKPVVVIPIPAGICMPALSSP